MKKTKGVYVYVGVNVYKQCKSKKNKWQTVHTKHVSQILKSSTGSNRVRLGWKKKKVSL